MFESTSYNPIDYLIIGHITEDRTQKGKVLGGTATYAGLTALSLGMKVGLVTSCSPELTLSELNDISKIIIPSEETTQFENLDHPDHRIQYLYGIASKLDSTSIIPEIWRSTPIVHFAPVAQEVSPTLLQLFPDSFIGLTLQGWLRDWDSSGRVTPCEWYESNFVLEKANAAVMSFEDINGDEKSIEEYISSIRTLVVTEGNKGSRVYWNGDLRTIGTPKTHSVDSTGAGDIFAAAFFITLYRTHNPWEAARFATQIASISTTRKGLLSIPTIDEIHQCQMEIVKDWTE